MQDMASDNDSIGKLLARRDRILAMLPPFTEIIRGSVFERSIRCGKPSCRCAEGSGHQVTYLGVTFPGGRTEQVTVPKDLVPAVRRWVANYLSWWRGIEEVSVINRRLLRLRQLTPDASEKPRPRRTRR
jgi:hypothetical protein